MGRISVGSSFARFLRAFVLSSFVAAAAHAAERSIDTGVIKVDLGDGGFIEQVHLDRNGDGTYSPDEVIAKRPPAEPAIVVSYVPFHDPSRGGIATEKEIVGKPRVTGIEIAGLRAIIKGTLVFDGLGSSPFEVAIEGKRDSAVLTADLSVGLLTGKRELALKEASLRLYGVFDKREPGTTRRSMSTGDFRNTPRPDSVYQPLVWQFGGHLVESPWYWRRWTSWSETTGPVTIQEGRVPPKELTFFMRDDRQAIQAALIEPAAVAPIEFSGIGDPATLGVFAWSPRVPPLPMNGELPDRLDLKGIGLHFFPAPLEALANKGDAYWKRTSELVDGSRRELLAALKPGSRTLSSPRFDPQIVSRRLDELQSLPERGWDANKTMTRLPQPLAVGADQGKIGNGWIEVQIDSPPATAGVPLPARGGIPFPPGALKSSDQIRLLNTENKEIPIQAETLAFWPDRSVKWVLVTLLMDGASSNTFRLEYGPHVARKAIPQGKLEIGKASDGVSIDTGAVRFTLNKSSGMVFGDLRFGASERPIVEARGAAGTARPNRMDLLALAAPAGYPPYSFSAEGAHAEPSRADIEEISVERQGAISAHILVKGRYRYATLGRGRGKEYRNEGNEFWIRYTVYAGQPYVEVKHSFVFEGNPDLEMIRDLSLSTPISFQGTPALTFGVDGTSEFTLSSSRGGIFQENAHAAEIWSADDATHSSRTRAATHATDGWIDASANGKGVTYGIRNMRQLYAKELSVEDGNLVISLWPKRGRLLDTRRYARQYGDGESSSFGQGTAQGVARSHDMFFYFHNGDAASAGSAQVARALLKPAFIKAPPAWYAGSTAAGTFRQREAKQFPAWEAILEDGVDFFLYSQELWSWYGFYDYGDWQQVPNGRGGWERLNGRWGWVNNEALIDMFLYEQFMRTGRRDYLDAALAMTRHTQEVDLINSNDYKGNRSVKMHGHRHNVNHWGDGYVGIRVAAPHGFRLGYYLTGDLRILDQLRMGMDAHWSSMHTYDKEHSAGLGYLTFFWETTGDPVYRDALRGYLDFQVKHFERFGHIHSGVWNFRKDAGRALPEAPMSPSPTDAFFQNFGSAYSLMELADLTGRKDLIESLVQLARDTMQQRAFTWEAQYCHYRLMAFAYRHTGDPQFLNYATQRAEKLSVAANRKSWASASAIERLDNKLSMFAWIGQGLPYLMQAIEMRAKDPIVAFSIPANMPMPKGKSEAQLRVDGMETRAREGAIARYEWQIDGKTVSNEPTDTLSLRPGKHQITLRATDGAGHTALAGKAVTVWEPGIVTRLCFRGGVSGFGGGEYNDTKGFGFTRGTRIIESPEPRRQGDKGCPEVHITGTVKVKAPPGSYVVEMGGADNWTETMGNIAVQGRPLNVAVTKESSKKLSWSYMGDAVVGADGMLTIDFTPGSKGEPVILAYIIVKEKR